MRLLFGGLIALVLVSPAHAEYVPPPTNLAAYEQFLAREEKRREAAKFDLAVFLHCNNFNFEYGNPRSYTIRNGECIPYHKDFPKETE